MDRTEEEIDELKSMLAVARKREINFAVCLGQNEDTTVFAMHRRKSPAVLGLKVKKEGETTKITTGTIRLKSKTLTLTCTAPPPLGTARQLRFYFRDFGLPLKIDIVEPGGSALEADGHDDGKDSTEILQPSTPKPRPEAAEWSAILPVYDAAVARAFATNNPKAGALQAAWDGAKSAAAEGRFKTALAVVKKIKPLVVQPNTDTPTRLRPDPSVEGWVKIERRLEALLERALATAPENTDRLQAAMDMARQKAADGDYKSAVLIAKKLSGALARLPDDIPDTDPTGRRSGGKGKNH